MPKKSTSTKSHAFSTNVFFEDNTLLPMLYGEGEEHLHKLESMLAVQAVARGNMVSISGQERDVVLAEEILNGLYEKASNGLELTPSEVAASIRMAPPVNDADVAVRKGKDSSKLRKHLEKTDVGSDIIIKTAKKTIRPYTHMQANYMRIMYDNDLSFALGPAGTGKTYIAVAMAVNAYLQGKVDKIILSRPAVEAGEKLGFLPGGIEEKIDPFLRPLYDALQDMLPADKVVQMSENGEIEVAPLAFMRGRTLSNAFVILDEAQNTTPTQMKMFLTRMGENSCMVITGDLSQTDLPKDIRSGLRDAVRKLEHIDGIGLVRFSDGDVVRHRLASLVVKAYNDWDNGIRPKKHDRYLNSELDDDESEEEEK